MIILLLVILFSAVVNSSTALIGSFAAGIMVDIWQAGSLGMHAVVFTVVSFLLNLYKRKYNPEHLIFLVPYTILVVIVVNVLDHRLIPSGQQFRQLAIRSSIGIIGLWLLMRIWNIRFAKKRE